MTPAHLSKSNSFVHILTDLQRDLQQGGYAVETAKITVRGGLPSGDSEWQHRVLRGAQIDSLDELPMPLQQLFPELEPEVETDVAAVEDVRRGGRIRRGLRRMHGWVVGRLFRRSE